MNLEELHQARLARRVERAVRFDARERSAIGPPPWSRIVVPLLACVLSVGCGIPRDPEGSLARVSGGTLRAGMIARAPWAAAEDGNREGVEVQLIESFAAELDARVEWFDGTESDLFDALHEGQLDVVVGGIAADTPHVAEAALTHPYVVISTVVGFPDGAPAEPSIEGREIAFEAGTAGGGLLADAGAVPVPVDDLRSATGARVVEDWMLDDLGLVDLGVRLADVKHVMAVRMGENALLVRLERFLLQRGGPIRRLLDEAQP